MRMRIVTLLVLTAAAAMAAETPAVCLEHTHYGRQREAALCYEGLLGSASPYVRAEGYWGLERYREANDQFRLAVEAEPKNAKYRTRWGLMYLRHYQEADAATLFQEALAIDPKNTEALIGLARVAAGGFEKKAVELARAALKANPQLVGAHELLAFLALEDGDEQQATNESDAALKISDEALEAMSIRATIDWLHDRESTPWIGHILAINPVYGEAYATAAHFFVLNRRYEEAIELYGKALGLNPRLWKARSERGVNLMRLAREEAARKDLEICYENGFRNAATVNTLRLMDSYKNFETFRGERTILRLHKKEAALLRPYFEEELLRAIETYDKKYKMKLDVPVRLEVYPDHEDFAVRTMGMPGLGALGVTFGTVVAMDSPSGRRPGSFHWASTLWHELSHVYTLRMTNHRVPRWFTEGMAVHEETAVSPEWGDRINGAIIAAIKGKKLLPVARLDRGFIRPSYPAQVPVSYFQAGRICDYINERWGYDTLLGMLADYGRKMSTPDVIRNRLDVSPEEFDEEFLAWLDKQVGPLVEHFDLWKKKMKALGLFAKMGDYRGIIEQGPEVRDLNPEYVGVDSAYEQIAKAHLERGDKKAAAAELERYMHAGGRSPAVLKQLAALETESGRKRAAAETLDRLNYIYPVHDEELHQRLGDLWFELGDPRRAIREYAAVVASHPIDRAVAQFNLAKAYQAAERREEAMEHVILALEAAPGYRPAQNMLLKLASSKEKE